MSIIITAFQLLQLANTVALLSRDWYLIAWVSSSAIYVIDKTSKGILYSIKKSIQYKRNQIAIDLLISGYETKNVEKLATVSKPSKECLKEGVTVDKEEIQKGEMLKNDEKMIDSEFEKLYEEEKVNLKTTPIRISWFSAFYFV